MIQQIAEDSDGYPKRRYTGDADSVPRKLPPGLSCEDKVNFAFIILPQTCGHIAVYPKPMSC